MVATRSDVAAPFANPEWVGGVATPSDEHSQGLSPDQLTIVFSSPRLGGLGGEDTWLATRTQPSAAFEEPVNLSEVNSGSGDTGPSWSPDTLSIYFASDRPGGSGGNDIWVATRPDPQSPFEAPVNVAELNGSDSEIGPELSADGTEIVFTSNCGGQWTLWRATRECL